MAAHKALRTEVFRKYHQAQDRLNTLKLQIYAPQVSYLVSYLDIPLMKPVSLMTGPCLKMADRSVTNCVAANYLRIFVPHYSRQFFSRSALALQDTEFKRGPEQQQSFDRLKEYLTGENIIVYPNFNVLEKYPSILLADAAPTGLRAVSTQRQPEGQTKSCNTGLGSL